MAEQHSLTDEYPWLALPWRRLLEYRHEQRVPQAVLIVGQQGLGKRRLAEAFAALMLCQEPSEFACGHCPRCRLLMAGAHPDYFVVQPAEPGKAISIDAVRSLIDTLSLKPQYSGHRVALLDPAHAMNSAAAKALLITLEEPPERTLMVLLSDTPSHLPATLVSRCQRLSVAPPPRNMALTWLNRQDGDLATDAALAAASNAPLKALELGRTGLLEQRYRLFDLWPFFTQGGAEPVQAAEKLGNVPLETLIDWLYSWASDVLKLSQPGLSEHLINRDQVPQLQAAARNLRLDCIYEFVDILQRSKRQLAFNAQLNRALLLEEICIAWWQLAKSQASGMVN